MVEQKRPVWNVMEGLVERKAWNPKSSSDDHGQKGEKVGHEAVSVWKMGVLRRIESPRGWPLRGPSSSSLLPGERSRTGLRKCLDPK